jgi:cation diffusion facilitator family transporter
VSADGGAGGRHPWRHDHSFGQQEVREGERRTLIVIAITGVMMVVEIGAGLVYGSMALLADGLHMASHTAALGISAFAYAYARRHARNADFSFGTGKVNALGGFTGAVLLAVFALVMAWESVGRFLSPVDIAFDQAIFVAVLGLAVNGVSALVLRGAGHGHDPQHDHDHHHDQVAGPDQNLRAAYLHVIADAATSVLAIAALLAGKYLGAAWMDPAMGLVGAALITRWSLGLLATTSAVLLDRQGPRDLRERIRAGIEADGHSEVADLHLWCIGPGIYAVVLTIVARDPATADEYRSRLPAGLGLAHVSIEVHRRRAGAS